jgi:hypothetical protein
MKNQPATLKNGSRSPSKGLSVGGPALAALNYLELGASSLRCGCRNLGKSRHPIHKIGDSQQIITGTREDYWVPKQHHGGLLRPSDEPLSNPSW